MRIYSYKIPLHPSPLALTAREGLIVEEEGLGEAAPLPSFSKESLSEALLDLKEKRMLASVQFCLRCAARPFPTSYAPVALSALVSSYEEARACMASGFSTLKIKVKGLSVSAALALVSKIQHPSLRLRIDVNRRWSFEEARLFFQQINPEGIEYIEEPIQDPERLLALPPIPFALDETLLEEPSEALLRHARAFVLKPTLLGNRLSFWIDKGRSLGKQLIFSSSFESAIGLVHLSHLQYEHAPDLAAGLDTYRAFKSQPLPFPLQKGSLLDTALPPLDRSWLQPLKS